MCSTAKHAGLNRLVKPITSTCVRVEPLRFQRKWETVFRVRLRLCVMIPATTRISTLAIRVFFLKASRRDSVCAHCTAVVRESIRSNNSQRVQRACEAAAALQCSHETHEDRARLRFALLACSHDYKLRCCLPACQPAATNSLYNARQMQT